LGCGTWELRRTGSWRLGPRDVNIDSVSGCWTLRLLADSGTGPGSRGSRRSALLYLKWIAKTFLYITEMRIEHMNLEGEQRACSLRF